MGTTSSLWFVGVLLMISHGRHVVMGCQLWIVVVLTMVSQFWYRHVACKSVKSKSGTNLDSERVLLLISQFWWPYLPALWFGLALQIQKFQLDKRGLMLLDRTHDYALWRTIFARRIWRIWRICKADMTKVKKWRLRPRVFQSQPRW